MPTFTEFKSGIYNWVNNNTNVTLIRWARQNDPGKISLPYIDLFIREMENIGQDYETAPNNTTAYASVYGNRDCILEISYYGEDAIQSLNQLYMSVRTYDVKQQFLQDEIVFVRKESILDLTELIDTRYEERALATFIMRYASEFTDDNAGVIGTVENMEIDYVRPDGTTLIQTFNIPD